MGNVWVTMRMRLIQSSVTSSRSVSKSSRVTSSVPLSAPWLMEPITEEAEFHLTEPAKWYECYTVADPEAFIEHMKKYNNLLHHALDRAEYETLCAQNNVEPMADDALDTYGMENGDFGMSHYHTVPENRQTGIANTIHQLRYRAIQGELKQRKQQAVKPAQPVKMEKCSCGHTVPSGTVMSASMGSSCPDCYDRMSD